ncbi:ABC transporter ATP-binding protein [Mangrovicoccus sp. HB161399]|uniref:ABC transporter ATP-binding protein n=1 Tax=Mangrovicoccus sp. HB161399 TaxID=2720392 RepID=UPI0015570FEA|nr:ABC transporter ATP-binding protein [Mangrovicoccus sp. HB161399]
MGQGEADTVLEARDLARSFQGVAAVGGMSLRLSRGEMLGLIGPNGAGKTTMFNMLAGSLPPSSGRILLDGRDVTAEGAERRLARGLGRSFQIPRPFPEMTVLENVLCGAQDQSGERVLGALFRPGQSRRDEDAAVEKARHLTDFLMLSHLENEPARILSGGQRKLLELARLMMADPQVLLLDEPAAGVNPSLLEDIMERIVALNGQGVSILLIEHNMDMVARLCSRVVVMALGRELAQGAPEAVIRDPEVVRAYLGDAA